MLGRVAEWLARRTHDHQRWISGNVHYVRLCNANKAARSGFETQRRRHQKSKTGVSVAPKIGHVYVSAKNIKKNKIKMC